MATYDEIAAGGILLGSAAAVYEIGIELTSGGITSGGEADAAHFFSPEGGVTLAGEAIVPATSYVTNGGVVGTGLVIPYGITHEPPAGTPASGAIFGSQTDVNQSVLKFYLSGGSVSVGSNTSAGQKESKYNASGGIILSSDTGADFRFIKNFEISWRKNAEINRNLSLRWNVGQLRIYWYRVVGKGITDPCLPQEQCCQRFILNVHARSLPELCEKLSKRRFKFPIESVQRFSRPAENSAVAEDESNGINHDCDVLEPVEVCQIPECADFCVDNDVLTSFGFMMRVQVDAFKSYVADGSAVIGGSAKTRHTRNVPSFDYVADGSLEINGSAICVPNSFVGRGGATLGGTSHFAHSRWSYIGGIWPNQTGQLFANEVESVATETGDQQWSLTERVKKDDGLFCTTDISYARTSQRLIIRNLGITIPDWANILSVLVRIDRLASQVSVRDLEVYLVRGDQIISDNLAVTTTDWPLLETTRIYGATGWRDPNRDDYLGPITREEVVDPEFGILLRIHARSPYAATIAKVDFVSVDVAYDNSDGSTIRIGGSSTTSGPTYHAQSSTLERIRLDGEAICNQTSRYQINASRSGVKLGGVGFIQIFETMDGGVAGSGLAKTTPYFEAMQGGAAALGHADVKPYWETMQGGVEVDGHVVQSGDWHHVASGVISVSGNALTPELKLDYTSSGTISISGSAISKTSHWSWSSDGNAIFILGSAGQKASSIGTPIQKLTFGMFIVQTSAAFLDDVHIGDAVGASETISKCGCLTMPMVIDLSHNLARGNIFSQFLARNNLTLANTLRLYYNEPNDSWQANHHFKGWAADANTQETWDLTCELQCTQVMGGVTVGSSVWKLAIQLFRKNLTTFDDFDTRIIVGVIPDQICGDVDNQLDFEVQFDTQLNLAIIEPDATIYQSVIFDNIGLFRNRSWVENPNLNLRVSQSATTETQTRVDLTTVVLG